MPKQNSKKTTIAPFAVAGPTVRGKRPKLPASESTLFVNSVEKAMSVLMVFNSSRPRLTLSQIAKTTGLDVSAAQRFVFTLKMLGYLFKNEQTKTYELSARLLDFGYHYLASNELVQRATPYLQQLSKETEETTNITVLDGTDIVFVQRMVSRHVLTPGVIVGSRMPAYCAAPGLAILSALPSEETKDILSRSDLVQYTAHTVTDLKAIHARLAEIRNKGYAHTENEYYLGDISTAVAVLGREGRPMGAINVAVAQQRWQLDRDEARLSSLLLSAARAISA